jgi:hypothetical protein
MPIAVALAAAVVLLAGCIGGPPPPPPPPTDPHDVLVVGDSMAFSFACVLGDDAGSGKPCPTPGGFTTKSSIVGGCTISGGSVLLYNSIATSSLGCSDWPSSWAQLADENVPKVVVIVTSGWEIMDRWSSFPSGCDEADASWCSPPDRQWGGGNSSAAASAYTASLNGAINLFQSRGAKVLVANAAYVNPPEPQFPPGTPNAPDFLIRAWYERYPVNNTTPPPEVWQAPNAGLSYRPSKAKVDQYNQAISAAVDAFGSGDVARFDFFKHFDPGNAYSDYVCPAPNDAEVPDANHKCQGGSVNAILARDADGGHLSQTSPGGQDILGYYLVPCVRGLLGVTGGDPAKCV